jgi:hypothetical protein
MFPLNCKLLDACLVYRQLLAFLNLMQQILGAEYDLFEPNKRL